jgi:hypothetical protein
LRFVYALHEARRRQAADVLNQYDYLIEPKTERCDTSGGTP